jgi:integrase
MTTLPNVKRTTVKGRTYYYHRGTGERIPGAPGEADFDEAYQRLERAHAERLAQEADRADTLGQLFAVYRASPSFKEKAPATRADYREAMDYLHPLDALPLVQIDAPFIARLRDRAFEQKKRWFANHLLRFLSALFNWARPYGHISTNPVEQIPKIRRPRGMAPANRPWTLAEVDSVMAALPAHLRVALALGAYAGLREGDVIRIQWMKYDGRVIESRQIKTGDAVWVPAHSDLRAALETEAVRRAIGGEDQFATIVVGARGSPFTESGFRACFFKVVRALTAAGTVQPGLTFHGLRHTSATMLADAGCDTRDIMSITGHRTEAMASHYAAGADRRRRAEGAIVKLEAFTDRHRKNGGK